MVGFSLDDMTGGRPIDTAETRMLSLDYLFGQVKRALLDCDFVTAWSFMAAIEAEVKNLEDLVGKAGQDAQAGSR